MFSTSVEYRVHLTGEKKDWGFIADVLAISHLQHIVRGGCGVGQVRGWGIERLMGGGGLQGVGQGLSALKSPSSPFAERFGGLRRAGAVEP